MKDNYTDINIVLDRSGSMESVKADTIGGFNTFLKEQQDAPGEASFTLVQFDNVYEIVHRGVTIKQVEPLTDKTFVPRGSTALLDAIGRMIKEAGKRLGDMPEDQRPAKVIFVIVTDGQENASNEFTTSQISDMIQHQRDAYKWEFVFLGANQDAISSAASIGVSAANALSYAANASGVRGAIRSLSSNVIAYRSSAVVDCAFTKADREEQRKAGVPEHFTSTGK